jgi:hypothetical protein
MPYIQENKVCGYKNGSPARKKHPHFSVTIPRHIIEFMGWKKGDEVEFKLEGGKVVLRRKG